MKRFAIKEEYEQERDCCSSGADYQTLTMETMDGGGGAYVVITTTRWAIDANEIDEFCNRLKKILKKTDSSL